MHLVNIRLMNILILLMLCLMPLGCIPKEKDVIELKSGPHLFLDDYLIAEQSFLNRTVNHPLKYPDPVITGAKGGDDNFQPYLTVLRDQDSGRFRMWYGVPVDAGHSHIAYIESEDGIHWIRPHRVLQDPHMIEFGVSVVDRGKNYSDPTQRYVFAAYMTNGMMISTSPDGLQWKALQPEPVLKHNHDITSLHWDPIHIQFIAIVSVWKRNDKWNDNQRTPYQSVSKDLLHWKKPWPIITAKIGAPIEQGETQFYAMSGVLARGDLLIGLVKILRDDLNATPGKSGKEMGDLNRKAAGLGYTVLAWSRDGVTWDRDHETFIPRNPVPGSWDHAMAWGDEQIIVGNDTYIYYGGYARGHKVDRFNERQIGLARMPLDRYVAREASLNMGTLSTKPLILNGSSLTVNAYVVGEMHVRLTDIDGAPLSDFGWIDISGDNVAHRVNWERGIETIKDKPVKIEFQLRNAQLFGFDLE